MPTRTGAIINRYQVVRPSPGCGSPVFIQAVRVPPPEIYDTIPGHHRAPQQLRILRIQPSPPDAGIRSVGIAVDAFMGARVVFADIDRFHASATLAERNVLGLVRDVQRPHHGGVDAPAGFYPVVRIILLGAAGAQNHAVFIGGLGRHPAEFLLLPRSGAAEHARIHLAYELPVDIHEAEDASVRPLGNLSAHDLELAPVVCRIDGLGEEDGVVPPHHPVPADPVRYELAGIAHIRLERHHRLDRLAIRSQRDLEGVHVPHGSDLPQTRNHRPRILGHELDAIHVPARQVDTVDDRARNGVANQTIACAEPLHEPLGMERRYIGATAGTDYHTFREAEVRNQRFVPYIIPLRLEMGSDMGHP